MEDWHSSVGEKAFRTLCQWKEGWTSVPLLSQFPSPTLDYDEKLRPLHLKLHQLTVDSKEVKAMVNEEFMAKLSWYKVIISSAVRLNQKMMASLFTPNGPSRTLWRTFFPSKVGRKTLRN